MNNEQIQKRQVAYKVRIKDITNGIYVREEGWQPNYVLFDNSQKISRINLIGTIVAKPNNEGAYQNLLLDDGSGKISVRFFQELPMAQNVDIGDIILLIGRIREYGRERYIVPEIIKKIENKAWIKVRKLELKRQPLFTPKKETTIHNIEPKIEEEVIEPETISPIQKIYDLIKRIDTGEGVDIEDIIQQSKEKDIEKIISTLLEKGEIFEIRKGKLKVLE